MMRARMQRRRGMATMEAVLAAGIALPIAGFLLFMGLRMCVFLYHVVGVLVGWPAF